MLAARHTALLLIVGRLGLAQDLPKGVTTDDLANDNKLFLALASKGLKWEEQPPSRSGSPAPCISLAPGEWAFLIVTSEGHILMNTGMPSSGPMIVESIRTLGFNPDDIKLMINGHAHVDHAGAFGFFKSRYGAQLAVMKDDVVAMENGDRDDFKYANDFDYPGVKVDRILRDGDTIRMGEVLLTAYHTPGHTRGATTGSETS